MIVMFLVCILVSAMAGTGFVMARYQRNIAEARALDLLKENEKLATYVLDYQKENLLLLEEHEQVVKTPFENEETRHLKKLAEKRKEDRLWEQAQSGWLRYKSGLTNSECERLLEKPKSKLDELIDKIENLPITKLGKTKSGKIELWFSDEVNLVIVKPGEEYDIYIDGFCLTTESKHKERLNNIIVNKVAEFTIKKLEPKPLSNFQLF